MARAEEGGVRMVDTDKVAMVTKGLECCKQSANLSDADCRNCPYLHSGLDCVCVLMEDAIDLLEHWYKKIVEATTSHLADNDIISRSALLAAYDAAHEGPPGGARKLIEEAPAIGVIPVSWLQKQYLQYEQYNDKLMCDAYAVVFGDWTEQQKEKRQNDVTAD